MKIKQCNCSDIGYNYDIIERYDPKDGRVYIAKCNICGKNTGKYLNRNTVIRAWNKLNSTGREY